MAKGNGQELPILVAGGGIGGLAAAHALARKGFPVRVLEQAPEFREIGAGIQLGPNVFNALEKLGLKDQVLADVHRPPAMEMTMPMMKEAKRPTSGLTPATKEKAMTSGINAKVPTMPARISRGMKRAPSAHSERYLAKDRNCMEPL